MPVVFKSKIHLKNNHSTLRNHAYYVNEKQEKHSLRLSNLLLIMALAYILIHSNNPSPFIDYF